MNDSKQPPLNSKQQSAVEKAERLVEWFKTAPRPAVPLEVDKSQKIVDVELFIASQCKDMMHNIPLGRIFINAYMRLYKLKQHILENEL